MTSSLTQTKSLPPTFATSTGSYSGPSSASILSSSENSGFSASSISALTTPSYPDPSTTISSRSSATSEASTVLAPSSSKSSTTIVSSSTVGGSLSSSPPTSGPTPYPSTVPVYGFDGEDGNDPYYPYDNPYGPPDWFDPSADDFDPEFGFDEGFDEYRHSGGFRHREGGHKKHRYADYFEHGRHEKENHRFGGHGRTRGGYRDGQV